MPSYRPERSRLKTIEDWKETASYWQNNALIALSYIRYEDNNVLPLVRFRLTTAGVLTRVEIGLYPYQEDIMGIMAPAFFVRKIYHPGGNVSTVIISLEGAITDYTYDPDKYRQAIDIYNVWLMDGAKRPWNTQILEDVSYVNP